MITREEFCEKYGEVNVKFSYYYKYTFTYSGVTDEGYGISVNYGGNGDDIYRHEVSADFLETVNTLYPFSGSVYDKEGKLLEEFYDY